MDLGDTLTFRTDLYDKPAEDGGVLVNAPTAALTITLPDFSTAAGITVANPPATTGKYVFDYPVAIGGQAGRYIGQWLFTLANGRTTSYVETFDVGQGLVTTDEALTHLRAAGIIVKADDLDYLQFLTMVATSAVERDLGRVIVPRTVVETFDGGRPAIVMGSTPLISVTSVTENGVTVAGTGYTVNLGAGIIYRGGQQSPSSWPWGRQNIVATVRAGYAVPPFEARIVALNIIQACWQTSQQSGHPLLNDVSDAGAVFDQAASLLTQPQSNAYESLRGPAFA